MTPRLVILIVLLAVAGPAWATSSLTLMSYNIHSGFPMGRSSRNSVVTETDLQNIADVITSAGADVVALQEVHCEWGFVPPAKRITSALNEPRVLSRITGMRYAFGSTIEDANYPTANQTYIEWGEADKWTNNSLRHGEFGNGMLSRISFGAPPTSVALPTEPGREHRGAVRVQLDTRYGGSPIVVYSTHLAHDSASARVAQFTHLVMQAAAETSTATVFIAGDLNFHADGPEANLLKVATDRGFRDLAAEFATAQQRLPDHTFPADEPEKRIDYILCSRPMNVLRAEAIETTASDHLPLVVEVDLAE